MSSNCDLSCATASSVLPPPLSVFSVASSIVMTTTSSSPAMWTSRVLVNQRRIGGRALDQAVLDQPAGQSLAGRAGVGDEHLDAVGGAIDHPVVQVRLEAAELHDRVVDEGERA